MTEIDNNSVINQGEFSMRGTEYPMNTHGTGIGESPMKEMDLRINNEISPGALTLLKLQEAALR